MPKKTTAPTWASSTKLRAATSMVRQRPVAVHSRRSTRAGRVPAGAAGEEHGDGRGPVVGVDQVDEAVVGGSVPVIPEDRVERVRQRAPAAGRVDGQDHRPGAGGDRPREGRAEHRRWRHRPAGLGQGAVGGGGDLRGGGAQLGAGRRGAELDAQLLPPLRRPHREPIQQVELADDGRQRGDDLGGADPGEAPELRDEALRVHHGGRVRGTDHQVDHGTLNKARVNQTVGLSTQSSPRPAALATFVAYCRYTRILRNVMTCPVTFPEDRGGAHH